MDNPSRQTGRVFLSSRPHSSRAIHPDHPCSPPFHQNSWQKHPEAIVFGQRQNIHPWTTHFSSFQAQDTRNASPCQFTPMSPRNLHSTEVFYHPRRTFFATFSKQRHSSSPTTGQTYQLTLHNTEHQSQLLRPVHHFPLHQTNVFGKPHTTGSIQTSVLVPFSRN